MVIAIGMRLADAAREHLWLVIAAMAVVILVISWPKIVQRIENRSKRH